MKQLSEKRVDKLIEQAYYRVANGVQIDVLDIGKIFQAGRAAYAEGRDVDKAVAWIVGELRKN